MSGIPLLILSALVYLGIVVAIGIGAWLFFRLIDAVAGIERTHLHSWSARTIQGFLKLVSALRVVGRPLTRLHHWLGQWPWRRGLLYLATPLILFVSGGVVHTLWYIYSPPEQPVDVDLVLNWHAPTIGRITDRKDRPVMLAYTEARDMATYDEIPPLLQAALRAGEDKDFYTHEGWHKPRTIYVTLMTLASKTFRFHYRPQGASTITQQVIRKVDPFVASLAKREKQHELVMDTIFTRTLQKIFGPVLTNRIARKLPEIRASVRMENALEEYYRERKFSNPRIRAKEAILAVHANMACLGHGVWGLKYAARFWFNKEMSQLTPDEAAFLVSLLPAPELRGRITDDPADRAMKVMYRNFVLQRMVEIGYLTSQEYITYSTRPLVLNVMTRTEKTEAPAAVDEALTEMERLGFTQEQLFKGDINLELTIDMDVQGTVNEEVASGIIRYTERFKADAVQMSFEMLSNMDAAIIALYGGAAPDGMYNNYTAYNRAVDARRQPGSTFKIFDVVAAIMAGVTPDTIVQDRRFCYSLGNGQNKCVENYDGKQFGPIPLWKATEMSRNLAFLHLMYDANHQVGGAPAAVKWAREMGVKSPLNPYISTVLGSDGIKPIEIANGFRTVCSGIEAEPYIIQRITDRHGVILYEHRHLENTRSFPVPPEKLVMMKALFRGTVALDRGTNHSLNKLTVRLMGKTGTSSNHRDAHDVTCTDGPDGHTGHGWAGYDEFSRSMPGDGLSIENRASGGSVVAKVCGEIFENSYGEGKPLGIAPPIPKEVEDLVLAYRAKAYQPPVTTK